VLVLAESAGLRMLAEQHLTVPTDKGRTPGGRSHRWSAAWWLGRTRSMTCGCCGTELRPGKWCAGFLVDVRGVVT
jgi:hypothetical protein